MERRLYLAAIITLSIAVVILAGLLMWSRSQCQDAQEALANIEKLRADHQAQQDKEQAAAADVEKQAREHGKDVEMAARGAKEAARASAHKLWYRFRTGIDLTLTRRCVLKLGAISNDERWSFEHWIVEYEDIDDVGESGEVDVLKALPAAKLFAQRFTMAEVQVATVTFGRGWRGLEIQEVKDWAGSVSGDVDASAPAMNLRNPAPPPKTVPISETSLGDR